MLLPTAHHPPPTEQFTAHPTPLFSDNKREYNKKWQNKNMWKIKHKAGDSGGRDNESGNGKKQFMNFLTEATTKNKWQKQQRSVGQVGRRGETEVIGGNVGETLYILVIIYIYFFFFASTGVGFNNKLTNKWMGLF